MILVLKLVTGEEIIAKEDSGRWHKPLVLVMGFDPEKKDQGNVTFAPWMIGSDPNEYVTINNSAIIARATPSDEALDAYIKAVGEDRTLG